MSGTRIKSPEMFCLQFQGSYKSACAFWEGDHFDDGEMMVLQRLPDSTYTRLAIRN